MTKWLLLAFALAPLAGCSSDESGPKTADSKYKSVTSFCTEWAKAACNDLVVSNCDDPDTATCIDHQSTFCEGLIPPGYSSVNAQDCIDAVKDAYADAELDAGDLDVVRNLGGNCSHLIAGPNKAGESCGTANDCDTVHNYTCVIKAGDLTGSCEIPQVESNGEPCDGAAMVCNSEAYCDGANCLVKKAEGKTCTYDAQCEDGDRCDIPDTSTDGSGTCTAKLQNKDTCTADSECASNVCLDTTSKCTSKVVLTGESSLCLDL